MYPLLFSIRNFKKNYPFTLFSQISCHMKIAQIHFIIFYMWRNNFTWSCNKRKFLSISIFNLPGWHQRDWRTCLYSFSLIRHWIWIFLKDHMMSQEHKCAGQICSPPTVKVCLCIPVRWNVRRVVSSRHSCITGC